MNIARLIDHTLLKPEATAEQIRVLAGEAAVHRFASVCVNGCWVKLASEVLRELGADRGAEAVKVCAVVGFPLGACRTDAKAFEAVMAVRDGAREIDMVISLGSLMAGDVGAARDDIGAVVLACQNAGARVLVKVILETAALTEEQVATGCRAAKEAGADFVKTSTGFHAKGGATIQAVQWLAKYGAGMGVKASGGIRDRAAAEAMIAAGATRLGTSNGVAIVAGENVVAGDGAPGSRASY